MEQKNTSPFVLERGLDWLWMNAREYKIPLLASFLFGMLAYGFTFTNKLTNLDDAFYLFEKGGTYFLGRWGLDILERIFPNVSMPWIYGIISIALISIAVCVICHIFHIHHKLLQILLAGNIIVFPSLTSTFSFMFTSSSYAVAFLFAVLAVLLIQAPSKKTFVFALGCMVFSLSIYQAYISVTASLLVIILIQKLFLEDDVKDVLQKGFLFLLFLGLSLIAYYCATQLVFVVKGSGFNFYAEKNMSIDLTDIPHRIYLAYHNFIYFLFATRNWLIPTIFAQKMNQVLVAAAVVLLFIWFISQKQKVFSKMLLLGVLIFILPLAIDCMYLFTTEDAVHTLVMYGFISFYVFIAILADMCIPTLSAKRLCELFRRLALEATLCAMALIVCSNIYVANEASLTQHLQYENTYSFYSALAADLQLMPEFNENTKLAVVGKFKTPEFYDAHLYASRSLTGVNGFMPDVYSRERFMEYYIGYPLSFAVWDEIEPFVESADFANMPVYPYYGSMKFFGDILVVKLSEV